MSSTRTPDLELERVVAAYIHEYRSYRARLWGASPQSILKSMVPQTIRNLIPFSEDSRNKECVDLLIEIKNADKAEARFPIIDLLGESARKAQSEKPSDGLTAWVSQLFIKLTSLWNETAHALRTLWVAGLKNSPDAQAFEIHIQELKTELAKREPN